MFDPYTEVKRLDLRLRRDKGKGEESLPVLNILAWGKEGLHYMHCLELDIVSQGETSKEAANSLAELIICQIEFGERHKTSIFHPAPKEYWQKLHEIQTNEIKQTLSLHPPRSAKEILSGLERVYA